MLLLPASAASSSSLRSSSAEDDKRPGGGKDEATTTLRGPGMQRAREASLSAYRTQVQGRQEDNGRGRRMPIQEIGVFPFRRRRPRGRGHDPVGERPASGQGAKAGRGAKRWECRRKPPTLTFLIPEQELSRVTIGVGADPPGLPHGRGVEGGLVGALPDRA